MPFRSLAVLALLIVSTPGLAATIRTPDEILAASPAKDWQKLNPADTLVMDIPGGRVIIALAPDFAPNSVGNIKALARRHYFDSSAIVRAQDNYVVQWSQDAAHAKTKADLKGFAEFEMPLSAKFRRLPDPDAYAPQAGFDRGFPAASDGKKEWLVHCYGMVGVGRDTAAASGNGTELYAVIGQAPRHLDRNITLVGRVLAGMDKLSVLPRGTAAMGFYAKPEQDIKITSIRLGSDLPPGRQARLEILRTDTPTFTAYVEARRNRHDSWFVRPAGHIDVCNIPVPVRALPQ